jgi:hypothetical protein
MDAERQKGKKKKSFCLKDNPNLQWKLKKTSISSKIHKLTDILVVLLLLSGKILKDICSFGSWPLPIDSCPIHDSPISQPSMLFYYIKRVAERTPKNSKDKKK